jgi:hypothetical protein
MTEDQNAESQSISWAQYMNDLMPLCRIKVEEFHLLGYGEVTEDEVLHCVHSALKGKGQLHEVVAGILSLNVGRFMNFMTMSAYKGKLGDGSFDLQKPR